MASISGFVWIDRNNNGVRESNETTVPRAVVLARSADLREMRTATDSSGRYVFEGLPEGPFEVEVVALTEPTNGPRLRKVTVATMPVDGTDFGFTTTGVKGVQLENATGSALAFTGAGTLALLAGAFFLIGCGGMVATFAPRRKRQ